MILSPHSMLLIKIACLNTALVVFSTLYASEAEKNSAEAWFYDDSDLLIDDVNEGELRFIKPIIEKDILFSESWLKITDSSLQTGWVELQQCYRNLDAIGKTDVVYQYKNIKNLRITSLDNIGDAKVNGQIIHLQDVASSAHLCVKAQVQVLEKLDGGRFYLRNGPYHRKFFDGYYPYHLSLSIVYPASRLKLNSITPDSQSMFNVFNKTGKLFIDTWFEGVLLVDIEFSDIKLKLN